MRTKILSWLLHHANREYKSEHFYKIKNQILNRYGTAVGFDTQHIPGKKCHSCGGKGAHPKFSYSGKIYDYADCYRCMGGWYKLPVWVYLQRIEFGKYIFHQPWKSTHTKPEVMPGYIEGYIEHKRSKHGEFARTILFLLYERGYLKRWYRSAGFGWRMQWWRPTAWPNNLIHIIKEGRGAIPFRRLKKKRIEPTRAFVYDGTDDLPF